ncbi:hypothetical protein [Acidiphilium acidophilum]|uniref:hypothetical protein n=1 Tax=Acidiphilium acidophilum TaxID=76588 RepID=UPI002E8E79AE|nr:hypothetical protein [Acidiphilium acidophilum]
MAAPEKAKGLFRRAAELMTRDNDPMEPRQAMRLVGGANEPAASGRTVVLLAELEAARSRIAAIELDAEKRRAEIEAIEQHMQALQAERDAAMRGQVSERERAQIAVTDAQKRTLETLQRAEKAEAAIQRAKTLPGMKGRLVRWLAGDVLPD